MSGQLSKVLTGLCLLLSSCESDRLTLTKDEIGCEAWKSSFNLAEQAAIIEDYLEARGVRVFQVQLFPAPDDVNYCMACTCTTGRLIAIRIDEEDQGTAEKLGFTLSQ